MLTTALLLAYYLFQEPKYTEKHIHTEKKTVAPKYRIFELPLHFSNEIFWGAHGRLFLLSDFVDVMLESFFDAQLNTRDPFPSTSFLQDFSLICYIFMLTEK